MVLVEGLEQVRPRRQGPFVGWRLGVPVRATVVLDMLEARRNLGQTGTHVGEGHRGPVGQVAFGGGTVPAEVSQHQLRHRFVAVEPARGRRALVDQRVGVVPTLHRAAADQRRHLRGRQHHPEPLAIGAQPGVTQPGAQRVAGEVDIAGQGTVDLLGRRVQRGVVDVELALELDHQATDAWSSQLDQPPDAIGADEVPGRAEDMGPQDDTVVEQAPERRLRGARCSRGHGPGGLTVVLRLDRQEPIDHSRR